MDDLLNENLKDHKNNKKYEKYTFKYKNAWENIEKKSENVCFDFCDEYKTFLDKGKTEREVVDGIIIFAERNGFVDFKKLIDADIRIEPGQKLYYVNKSKSMILCTIGKNPLEHGINIIGSHIDAPRVDLKQTPLYEDTEMAYFETHYYGGIKKYQWVTIPLALHGIIFKRSGETVKITIGEEPSDPVFVFTDLLPHLAQEQMLKKMSEGITGEGLNLLIGSIPVREKNISKPVKMNLLKIINKKYGLTEEDFISAELEIVPAFKASDVGFDRGLIGAYGQDDRSCVYASMKAIFDDNNEIPERTSICLLTDKEEIGSVGNTSAQGSFFINFIVELCALTDTKSNIELIYRRCFENSYMLSADVNAAVDPNYEGVQEKRNASYINKGVVIQKYTGSRGKSDASDANPEYIAKITKQFTDKKISWQTGDLGKVDLGGGGTIAQYIANLGTEVLDCGPAILSMHSPFEVSSKIDIYETYRAYKAFYNMV